MRTTIIMMTPPAPARRGRAGLTLIELMVALSILVILTLAVSQILASAQRVVTIGHAGIRSHGKIGALKNAVRDDFRRATPAGFLYLDSDGFLAFTTAGPADALSSANTRDGAATIATYGRQQYKIDATTHGHVLHRICLLLLNRDSVTLSNNSDAAPFDLANFQSSAEAIDDVTDDIKKTFYLVDDAGTMNLLQKDLLFENIEDDCWKVMTHRVTNLEFFWTDGQAEDLTNPANTDEYTLKWYGGRHGKRRDDNSNPIEGIAGADPYKAHWTNETDPKDWPKAIKMVVTFIDDTEKPFTYEIICPVGP